MRHRRLRLLAAVCTVALATMAAPRAHAAAPDAVAVIRVEGFGHGHGVGLSQWGAHDMALAGANVADILAQFYPGTTLGQAGGEVIVGVEHQPVIRIEFPGGGLVQSNRGGEQAEGFPIEVAAGGSVEVHRDPGGYRVIRPVHGLSSDDAQPFTPGPQARAADDCVVLCSSEPEPEPEPEPSDPGAGDKQPSPKEPKPEPAPEPTTPPTTTAPAQPAPEPEPQPAPPSDPVSPTPVFAVPHNGATTFLPTRGRSYRGLIEVTAADDGLRARNHVDVENYLKGMAEVPSDWPAAAVQAQAVAARTYALRAMATAGEICDSERCQVYVGAGREAAGQTRAVDATRSVVVTHGGRLAATFYSASGGGYSATLAEGFGTPTELPYLQANPEPAVNTQPWSVDVALVDVASRLGYPGAVQDVTIASVGPSGRALEIVLDGDAGPMSVDPQDFRRRLGLRSTLFSTTTASSELAPPPPAEEISDVVGDPDVDAGFSVEPTTAGQSLRAINTLDTGALLPLDHDGPAPLPVAVVLLAFGLLALVSVAGVSVTHAAVDATGWDPRRRVATLPVWLPRTHRR